MQLLNFLNTDDAETVRSKQWPTIPLLHFDFLVVVLGHWRLSGTEETHVVVQPKTELRKYFLYTPPVWTSEMLPLVLFVTAQVISATPYTPVEAQPSSFVLTGDE